MPEIVLGGMRPSPKQFEFLESEARFTAYGGARGGGKSWAMRRKLVLLALKYPNLRLLLLRRTFAELEGNHILPLQGELNGIAKYNADRKAFTFTNGSIIKLGFCAAEQDVFQYQGQEYDVIGFEEATQFTEYQMEFIKTCNRSVRTDFKPKIYYTCNPGGVGHDYIKRLFIDKNYRRGETAEDYKFIKATVYDNYVLMQSNPEYVSNLESLPDHLRRAFLDGDWDVIEGQYFEEFRREIHVCKPFKIPEDWKRFRAMDYGFNDPCAVLWFAIAPDRHMFVYRELYKTKRIATDMAFDIKAESRFENIAYTVASPDMWQKRGVRDAMGGECVAETFMKCGVPIIRADNSRINGWQRIRENLALAPDGVPYLQIFPDCTNLIRTLPTLSFDEHDREDVSDKCEDHAPEALRYGCMSRPSPSTTKPDKKKSKYGYDPFDTGENRKVSGFFEL